MKLKLIIPAGLLVLGGLAACSTDANPPAAAPAGNQQAAETPAQPAGGTSKEPGEKKEEEPLTGDLKEKAEAAALAAYPGTVLKSEHDAENPGLYAVEIKQSAGTVEVYLDKQFTVVKTKKEEGDDD